MGRRVAVCLLTVVCLVSLLAGCSGGDNKFTLNNSVQGTLKMSDGTPVAGVLVQFVPDSKEKSLISSGTTDDGGNFSLKTENNKAGAVLGKHHVVVIAGRGGKVVLPVDYMDATKTPLVVEVTAEEHNYPLTIKK